jgi:hypothetical protein
MFASLCRLYPSTTRQRAFCASSVLFSVIGPEQGTVWEWTDKEASG